MRDDIILLTPRWTETIMTDSREEPLCALVVDGPGWFLMVRIDDRLYSLPVREGEPEGELVDVAPGIKAWTTMEYYGLQKLGPGVWRVTPSLFVPGELHAFLVLCDIPEPAPFTQSPLFSATGERLSKQQPGGTETGER